jgi:hypothetical protein
VRNNPRVNYVEDNEDKDRKIRKLLEELGNLRNKLAQGISYCFVSYFVMIILCIVSVSLVSGGLNADPSSSRPADLSLSKLVGILKRLGVAASLGPDGALLVNGKKFTLDDLGESGDRGDDCVF